MSLDALSPRQWYRIENAASDEADIDIYGDIGLDDVLASDFISDIGALSNKTLNVHLNTRGGDVFEGIEIYNALKEHPAFINVYIRALAASIGTVIAMAGDRIVIAPHARMMIHDAAIIPMRPLNAADLEALRLRVEATSENIAAVYAERSGKDASYWRTLMRAETWFTDKEAVSAGLADEVGRSGSVTALKQAAAFDLSEFRQGERIAALMREELAAEDEPVADEAPELVPAEGEPTDSVEQIDVIAEQQASAPVAEDVEVENRLSPHPRFLTTRAQERRHALEAVLASTGDHDA